MFLKRLPVMAGLLLPFAQPSSTVEKCKKLHFLFPGNKIFLLFAI